MKIPLGIDFMNKLLTTILCFCALSVFGVNTDYRAFNQSQFTTSNPASQPSLSIRSGVLLTNVQMDGTTTGGSNLDIASKFMTKTGQQAGQRLPPLIAANWNMAEVVSTGLPSLSNLYTSFKSSGWYDVWSKYEKPYIFFDYTWQSNTYAANRVQWNPEYFPSGVTNITRVHSNGFRAIAWTQDRPASGIASVGFSNQTLIDLNFPYMATNFGFDGFWFDTDIFTPNDLGIYLAANALATVGRSDYFEVGAASARQNDSRIYEIVSAVHPNVSGDPTDFGLVTNIWNFIQTNKLHKLTRPGHFLSVGIVGYFTSYTTTENESYAVMAAMLSSPFYCNLGFGVSTLPTNTLFLDILRDPAVIGAERVAQTNGCDIYVKPLGGPAGPNYAISILNISNAAATVTINFTNLLKISRDLDPFVFIDVKNRTNDGPYVSSKTVTVPSHATEMWLIKPAYDTDPAGTPNELITKHAPLASYAPGGGALQTFYPTFVTGTLNGIANPATVEYWLGRWSADGLLYLVGEQGTGATGLILQHTGSSTTHFGTTYANLSANAITFVPPITGNATGLTNGSPGLATNNATASDGMALVKRGNNLRLENTTSNSFLGVLMTAADANLTNYWWDFGRLNSQGNRAIYQSLSATTNINFIGVTNCVQWDLLSFNIVASGANRLISVPTNLPHMDTNGWDIVGPYYTRLLLTNHLFRGTLQSNITLETLWHTPEQ